MGASRKRYNASIHIHVIVPIGYDYDTELLEQQVRLVDEANPWRSKYLDGSPAPSIHWMSRANMREGEWIDRIYSVEVRPPFLLTRELTHAYERYGNTLARELASIVPKDVLRVDYHIEIRGTQSGATVPAISNPRPNQRPRPGWGGVFTFISFVRQLVFA